MVAAFLVFVVIGKLRHLARSANCCAVGGRARGGRLRTWFQSRPRGGDEVTEPNTGRAGVQPDGSTASFQVQGPRPGSGSLPCLAGLAFGRGSRIEDRANEVRGRARQVIVTAIAASGEGRGARGVGRMPGTGSVCYAIHSVLRPILRVSCLSSLDLGPWGLGGNPERSTMHNLQQLHACMHAGIGAAQPTSVHPPVTPMQSSSPQHCHSHDAQHVCSSTVRSRTETARTPEHAAPNTRRKQGGSGLLAC